MINWTKYVESFLSVVEAKSFVKASRLMHSTSSALSKHISSLEQELDTKLLQRTTRQIKLTDAGLLLYTRCKNLHKEWDDIKREVMQQTNELHGLIRIGSRTSNQYIVLMIIQFLKQYPQMSVDLTLTNRRVDLAEENIDIFISHDNFFYNPTSLETQLLRSTFRHVIGAPRYFRYLGEPQTPKELALHNCLVKTTNDSPNVWELNGKNYIVKGNFSGDHINSLILAAVNSLGLIWVPPLLVVHELRKKQLKIVLPEYHSSAVKTFAYYQKHRFIPQKIHVFLQFLTQQFSVK
ncbi:MAG: LysR family transcriptional regulator [uncultured bacterium]|nr:MAG: LysR family transcriptional regulator [uncultured bacterium]